MPTASTATTSTPSHHPHSGAGFGSSLSRFKDVSTFPATQAHVGPGSYDIPSTLTPAATAGQRRHSVCGTTPALPQASPEAPSTDAQQRRFSLCLASPLGQPESAADLHALLNSTPRVARNTVQPQLNHSQSDANVLKDVQNTRAAKAASKRATAPTGEFLKPSQRPQTAANARRASAYGTLQSTPVASGAQTDRHHRPTTAAASHINSRRGSLTGAENLPQIQVPALNLPVDRYDPAKESYQQYSARLASKTASGRKPNAKRSTATKPTTAKASGSNEKQHHLSVQPQTEGRRCSPRLSAKRHAATSVEDLADDTSAQDQRRTSKRQSTSNNNHHSSHSSISKFDDELSRPLALTADGELDVEAAFADSSPELTAVALDLGDEMKREEFNIANGIDTHFELGSLPPMSYRQSICQRAESTGITDATKHSLHRVLEYYCQQAGITALSALTDATKCLQQLNGITAENGKKFYLRLVNGKLSGSEYEELEWEFKYLGTTKLTYNRDQSMMITNSSFLQPFVTHSQDVAHAVMGEIFYTCCRDLMKKSREVTAEIQRNKVL